MFSDLKFFRPKIFLYPKFFGPYILLDPKFFSDPKFSQLGPENFESKKHFGKKNFGIKMFWSKDFGQKKCRVKIFFGQTKFVEPKKCWVEKKSFG